MNRKYLINLSKSIEDYKNWTQLNRIDDMCTITCLVCDKIILEWSIVASVMRPYDAAGEHGLQHLQDTNLLLFI